MQHFVQLTPTNASPPTENVSLLPASQSLPELGGRNSNLEDPLPSPQLVLSRRQSLHFNLSFSPVQNSISTVSLSAPPQSFPGGAPLCLANLWNNPQTVLELKLFFCNLFQNYKNTPNFENSFKTFFPKTFPLGGHSPSRNQQTPTIKNPTLSVTLDCGYESGQGFWGGGTPPERAYSPTNALLCYNKITPKPSPLLAVDQNGGGRAGMVAEGLWGRVRTREREREARPEPTGRNSPGLSKPGLDWAAPAAEPLRRAGGEPGRPSVQTGEVGEPVQLSVQTGEGGEPGRHSVQTGAVQAGAVRAGAAAQRRELAAPAAEELETGA
jgi:hypothetical protein